MNFTIIENIGEWLKNINHLIISKIYYVDYINDKGDDTYLPSAYILLLKNFDYFIEIESNFDGEHLKLNYFKLSESEERISVNDLKNQSDLRSVFEVNQNDKLGKFIGTKIESVEYGIDKDKFEIKGEKSLFTFFRLIFENSQLTFLDGGPGIYVSEDMNLKLDFEETFDIYKTKY